MHAIRPLVLVVEDDVQFRSIQVGWLRALDLEVAEAGDGEEALAFMAERTPDLVCLDLRLPIKSGFEVLRHMRTAAATRSVPVLVTSERGSLHDYAAVLEHAPSAYLARPIGRRAFSENVRRLLSLESPDTIRVRSEAVSQIQVEPREPSLQPVLGLAGAGLLARFFQHSLRRRWYVVAASVVIGVGAALGALWVMPPTYRVDTRILIYSNYILPGLTNPGRTIPPQAQQGTRGAVELIKSRDNLIGVIEDAGLLAAWRQTRPLLGQFADFLRELLDGPPSPEDTLEALVSTLDEKLWATVDNNVIIITFTWHDRETALGVVNAAKDRFLDQWRSREADEFRETIRILESNLASARATLETAATQLGVVARARLGSQRLARRAVPPQAVADASAETTAQALRLEQDLASKRQELARAEVAYEERLRTAETRLNDLRRALGPRHPDVLNAVRELEALATPPTSLDALRGEVASLDQGLRRSAARQETLPNHQAILDMLPREGPTVDPRLERSLQRYRQAEAAYYELADRLSNAHMELDAATAGFSFRYSVTLPPVLPRRPYKPEPLKVLLSALLAALMLGAFFAVVADVRSGRILEAWQVDRTLGFRVLGQLDEL